jgi:hypothetical protein
LPRLATSNASKYLAVGPPIVIATFIPATSIASPGGPAASPACRNPRHHTHRNIWPPASPACRNPRQWWRGTGLGARAETLERSWRADEKSPLFISIV